MATQFNVAGFKAALTQGGLRPNQFQVQLAFPSYARVGGGANFASTRSTFLVSVAEIPGQTVNPAIVQYRGREVKFAGDRTFAPYTMTVLNDTDMSIRTAMENWMSGMEDLQNKFGNLVPNTYQCDVDIAQLDRNGNELRVYMLRDAFPVDLSPIALDFGANDQISTFQVTMQYQYFNINP